MVKTLESQVNVSYELVVAQWNNDAVQIEVQPIAIEHT